MKAVVLDAHTLNPGDNPWDDLAQLVDLAIFDRTPAADIVSRARDAEIVLTNKTPLSAQTLSQLPRLRFIAVLATGYNIVDTAAARARDIDVSNVPEYGTDSVAQHTMALLLELTNRTGAHHAAVEAGEWAKAPDFCFWKGSIIELAGLTMGIVGFGRIGRRVGALAHAFGMRVIAARRTQLPEVVSYPFAWRQVPELFAEADVVSLHCPLTADNAQLVGAAMLARMKPTAYLINTARGGLLDETAVAASLAAGRLAGAAIDVVSSEPIVTDNPLLGAPNCIITPHLAWASLAARRRLMATTVENVRTFLAGGATNRVN